MRKLIFLGAFFSICTLSSNAQLGGALDKAKSVASAAGFDVKSLTSGIMSKLVPGLSLTTAQQPKVTDAITGFLTQKAGILSLQKSNPAQYEQKRSGFFADLKTKLTGILVQNQMNKLLGMKPATNNPANVLSQLFF